MASPPPAIVFDLDGTLVDSLPDIVASFQYAFTTVDQPVPDDAAVRAMIGEPLEAMYARFCPDRVPELCAAYRDHYPRNYLTWSRPFPGVVELLGTLRHRGYKLAVATTKRTYMARDFVEALGLSPLLDHVQGTDGFPHKPAPDIIYRALDAIGARGLWMVGDTLHDIRAGKAAGLQTYAVTCGLTDATLLASAGPDVLHPDLSRLLDLLPAVEQG